MTNNKFDVFLSLTKKAFKDITFELVNSKFTQSYAEKISKKSRRIVIIIGIAGYSKGRIHLECDMETANKFAVAMNFGDELADEKELYMYMAEFANMVCGRAATYINDEFKEREAWLTPPAIFSGEELEIISPKINSTAVCFSGEQGNFHLDIGFEERI